MIKGILFLDNESIIVVHLSKGQNIKDYKFENDNVFFNPKQFETRWGWDFAKIHISNYEYIKKYKNVNYVIFLTSNMLMFKNPKNFIYNYDCGFSEYNLSDNTKRTPPLLISENQFSWAGDIIKKIEFKNILLELNSNNIYGCVIDGSYVNNKIMNKICFLYNKYYKDTELLKYNNAPEEKIFPTIACNLTDKISDSLVYFNNSNIKINLNNYYFIKNIERNMKNSIRLLYYKLINYS